MRGTLKKAVLNGLVLLMSLVFAIILSEGLVRVFSVGQDDTEWVGAEKKFYEYDSLLGWRKIPNLNTTRTTSGRDPVAYVTNSRSIRGGEYSYNKADDEYRIVVLGDSFADGYMVEFNEMFSEVMKKRLNDMNLEKKVEVINTGTSGWSTDQELIFFQNEGRKYEPDLTILMFYENDITYNNQPKDWGMYYKPMFNLKDGELVLTNVPVPKPDIFIIHEHLEPETKSLSKRVRGWLNLNSYLYKLVKERINNTYKLKELVSSAGGDAEKESKRATIPKEYRVWERNYNNTVRKSWEITEAMIVKLGEEASSIGSDFLVVNVPFEGSVHVRQWEVLKKKFGLSDEDWSVEMPGKVLEGICVKNGLDFINPTLQLRRKAEELEAGQERLYDPLDHHWNVAGNRLVGELLADYAEKYFNKER